VMVVVGACATAITGAMFVGPGVGVQNFLDH